MNTSTPVPLNLHNPVIRVRVVPTFGPGPADDMVSLSVWTRDNAELIAMSEWDSAASMIERAATLPHESCNAWQAEFWI